MTLEQKYQELLTYIRSLGKAAVAFSGGVDSTFLLNAAKEALGDQVLALTCAATFVPGREQTEAEAYCRELGISQIIFETDARTIPGFSENPKNRCYLCKKALFGRFLNIAKEQGCEALLEGSNVDDEGDYRPGIAAIRELGVISPLKVCGFTKMEIRQMSQKLGLPTWNKPSFACLASRFPYGETITAEKLKMVEKGEDLLFGLGFSQFRVRIHGSLARLELLPEEFGRLLEEEVRTRVYTEFKSFGFTYVALDIYGYRTGSMNETIL